MGSFTRYVALNLTFLKPPSPLVVLPTITRVSKGFGQFWKVIEIDNAVFQDLESFGKREDFQTGYGKVLDFCLGKNSNIS